MFVIKLSILINLIHTLLNKSINLIHTLLNKSINFFQAKLPHLDPTSLS